MYFLFNNKIKNKGEKRERRTYSEGEFRYWFDL